MALNILIISILVMGILFDYLSVFYKTTSTNKNTGKLLSSASLTQFYSRICYLCSTFLVVFIREQFNIIIDYFEIIFNSVFLSLIIFCIALKHKIIFKVIFKIPNIIIESIHNYKFTVVYDINFNIKIDRVLLFGAIINLLIFIAILTPFIIIKYFPNLAMSSVYSAQAINFLSNLLLLTFYDPRVSHLIDINEKNLRGQMLGGKLISYIIILLFYFIL
jgi:hypothetical protein